MAAAQLADLAPIAPWPRPPREQFVYHHGGTAMSDEVALQPTPLPWDEQRA
jgi:hypothetical protein